MWRGSALHVRTHNLNRRPNIEQIGEQISHKKNWGGKMVAMHTML